MIPKIHKKIFLISSIIFINLIFIAKAEASVELSFSGINSILKKGDHFSIEFVVDVSKKSINVVDGSIIYNKNNVQVESIDKEKSIFNMWAREPIFDNQAGRITFIGGVNNGFIGNGKIFRINFIANNDGTTTLDFLDNTKVFLNDGKGSSLNPWLKPISFEVHPNNKNEIEFSWWRITLAVCILMVIFTVKKYELFKK